MRTSPGLLERGACSEAGAFAVRFATAFEAGEFQAGQSLSIAELSRRFGASHPDVKMGLGQLRTLGIVAGDRSGPAVAWLSPSEADSVLEVAETLLDLAVRRAAVRCGEAGAPCLEEALAAIDGALVGGGIEGFARARTQLLAVFCELAASPELPRLFAMVRLDVLRGQFGLADLWRRHAREWYGLGSAILAGNPAVATERSRAHFRGLRAHVEMQERDGTHGLL